MATLLLDLGAPSAASITQAQANALMDLPAIDARVAAFMADQRGYNLERLRATARMLSVPNARRKQAPRLLREIEQRHRLALIREARDHQAVAQWQRDVAHLQSRKPWEMTRAQWDLAGSLVTSAVGTAGTKQVYDMAGLTTAMDAFYAFFGYSHTGAYAAKWADSNRRHEVQVLGALENGADVPAAVLAEYPEGAGRQAFQFESSHGQRFEDLLAQRKLAGAGCTHV